jgi:hypothetical protein
MIKSSGFLPITETPSLLRLSGHQQMLVTGEFTNRRNGCAAL